MSEKKSNPNNYRDCDFSTIRETGHCYMHEKKPDHVCKAHIKKQPTEEKMSFFTKALRFMAMRKKIKQNPNNCHTCDFFDTEPTAHCYMFKTPPIAVCTNHTKRSTMGQFKLFNEFIKTRNTDVSSSSVQP